AVDPVTGEEVLVLAQHDVTSKVVAERHLALVMEAEHRLLEQIFPRHILKHVTEECTAAEAAERSKAASSLAAAAAAAASAAAGGTGTGPSEGPANSSMSARGMNDPRWRPAVRDYTTLATWHPEVRACVSVGGA
ncbi:hypothetical protein Agub_g9617, partial [Astrephomene gubernaculifera]